MPNRNPKSKISSAIAVGVKCKVYFSKIKNFGFSVTAAPSYIVFFTSGGLILLTNVALIREMFK